MVVGNKVLEMVLQNHKNTATLINVKCFTLLPFPHFFFFLSFQILSQ